MKDHRSASPLTEIQKQILRAMPPVKRDRRTLTSSLMLSQRENKSQLEPIAAVSNPTSAD
ncbi:hypothetical protein BX589_13926 [Paraburkholderia fungorum]|jgi:hypothetical protein|nr:hypothetical protein BX589_13926 [Paraburkholderia fungorum]